MTEAFKASNGVELGFGEHGHIMLEPIATGLGEQTQEALREFFQHERDQELGRWRWPDNPDFVVYPDGTSRRVVKESTGQTMSVSLHDRKVMETYLDSYVGAARAYDAAHPQSKPWMEVPEGVYAMRPNVHLYERLIMFRGGKWHHLYKHHSEESSDPHSDDPEKIAEAAFREGRLTRLVAEVSDA